MSHRTVIGAIVVVIRSAVMDWIAAPLKSSTEPILDIWVTSHTHESRTGYVTHTRVTDRFVKCHDSYVVTVTGVIVIGSRVTCLLFRRVT